MRERANNAAPRPVMSPDPDAYRLMARATPERLDAIDTALHPVVAIAADYEVPLVVPAHCHSRAQLMHPIAGTMVVASAQGRWIVPHGHALWMPAGVVHEVEMIGRVRLRSAYVRPGARPGLPEAIRVVAMTPLLHQLLLAAVDAETSPPSARDALVLDLILEEIPGLRERPLALPMPRDARLAAPCQAYLADPSHPVSLDAWAERAGMSRRSFSRHFQHDTGLSVGRWRQQASLLAALPRLAEGEPVTRVALDLGYDSASAFTAMFRRVLGSSPRTYASAYASAAARPDAGARPPRA